MTTDHIIEDLEDLEESLELMIQTVLSTEKSLALMNFEATVKARAALTAARGDLDWARQRLAEARGLLVPEVEA